jgi:hypothetical protein
MCKPVGKKMQSLRLLVHHELYLLIGSSNGE